MRDAEAVLILSHTYWRIKFGGDPNIVGQVFEMNDRPHRVIGVLPNVPHYPQENDVYMPVLACPFRAQGERNIPQNRRAFGALNVFGRLKEGATAGAGRQRRRRDLPQLHAGQRLQARSIGPRRRASAPPRFRFARRSRAVRASCS